MPNGYINALLDLDLSALREQAIWEKGFLIPGREFEGHLWRMDAYGRTIHRHAYGDASSPYGWEFDHYPIPQALDGPNTLDNLRPLHCRMNRRLGGLLGHALKRQGY